MGIADESVDAGAKVITQKSKNTPGQKFKTVQVEDGKRNDATLYNGFFSFLQYLYLKF